MSDSGRNVLVIGGGAREHAIATALDRDPGVGMVHVAPGTPIMAQVAELHPVDPMDGQAVVELAQSIHADLVIIGPEAPLVAGIADLVREAGIPCFGPSKAAAEIEGSKSFGKEVMSAAGVPTAEAKVCASPEEAAEALDYFGAPYVVKDDGLAGGKGVVVTEDRDVAMAHAERCGRVVVEEYLEGPEVSLFSIVDGTTIRPFLPAQDYKRSDDNDEGPMTGGMGAYAPLDWAPKDLTEQVVDHVVRPVVEELAKRGTPFSGLLYTGLALTPKGVRVVEFNCRFGDPETQPLLTLLETPLGEVLYAAATGKLEEQPELKFYPGYAIGVVIAAEGYPAEPITGQRVFEGQFRSGNIRLYHGGTARDASGNLIVSGGRVFTVTGRGHTLMFARNMVYAAISHFHLDQLRWRADIGEKAARGQVVYTAPAGGLFQ